MAGQCVCGRSKSYPYCDNSHMQKMPKPESEAKRALARDLERHLTTSHYPPIPLKMVRVCMDALDAVETKDWDRIIKLPDGVLFEGREYATANEVIAGHHLEKWLPEDEWAQNF